MHRVMAVSIEEDVPAMRMTVRLASNAGDLSNVEEGFRGLARILERAARRGSDQGSIVQHRF